MHAVVFTSLNGLVPPSHTRKGVSIEWLLSWTESAKQVHAYKIFIASLIPRPHPAFCHLLFHTASDGKLAEKEANPLPVLAVAISWLC